MSEASPIRVGDPLDAVTEFFGRLGRCCARVDYDAAQVLFASDVASFGTRAAVVSGLERLRREQWEGVWGRIEAFAFDLAGVRGGGDAGIAWGMAPWTSVGFDAGGERFERPGRATVVLERRDGEWVAVHTHFSLAPGIPPVTHEPARA